MIDAFYEEQFKSLGFSMCYGHRTIMTGEYPEPHTIAIAYKASEWVLIDCELINFSDLAKWFPDNADFHRPKQAMLCIL